MQLTNTSGVAILRCVSEGKYRVAASSGFPLLTSVTESDRLSIRWPQSSVPNEAGDVFPGKPDEELIHLFRENHDPQAQQMTAWKCPLGDSESPTGFLILLHQKDGRLPLEVLRVSVELANGFIVTLGIRDPGKAEAAKSMRQESWSLWPRGITWKTRMLRSLNQRLLSDSIFVDKSLRSVGDGLLVAGTGGQIVFVNRRAADILGNKQRSLLGSSLLGRLDQPEKTMSETLERLLVDRSTVEREITLGGSSPRHFILRLSPVCENDADRGRDAVVGIVVSRGVPIKCEFEKNLPVVMVDSDLIAQAVTNVIANAIKYSPPGREILVSVWTEGNDLRIEVADKGYGIAPENVKRIFEKFYRVPHGEHTDEPGTGLGLTFVREIMDAHGGYVTLERGIRVGSAVILRLPPRLQKSPKNNRANPGVK